MDFFGIGILEFGVIMIVALLVLGPNQLPQVARKLGTALGQARKAVAETRDTFMIDLDEQAKDGNKGASATTDVDGYKPVDHRLS